MPTYVVRVWIPDRPGALGQVASRIGAVRGDVIGIEILERGAGQAIDDLVVTLPAAELLDLLVREISQVDDVAVEHVRAVASEPAEHGVMALGIAAQLVESAASERSSLLCYELVELLEADWAVVVGLEPAAVLAQFGLAPDLDWLSAFLEGTRHLPGAELSSHTPSDLAWAYLPRCGAAVAVGRPQRAFRSRERQMVELLGRIADTLG